MLLTLSANGEQFAQSMKKRVDSGLEKVSSVCIEGSVNTNITSDSMHVTIRIDSVRPKEERAKISDPLCTLFITFCDMDYPQKEVTTKHVFSTKKQRQYPQTRKVVLTPLRGPKRHMLSSPSTFIDQSEDELEHYERRRLGSAAQTYSSTSSHTTPGLYSNHVVQEVSLSYSAPLIISPPSRDVPLSVQIAHGDGVEEFGHVTSGGSLQDYLHQYEARVAKPRHIESVERVTASGRHETEFPVRIAYIGGDSVTSPVHAVPIVSIGHPYRIYDSRATTPRITDTIISETTTIEEMTTITTTNHRRGAGPEMSQSPTNVNALTQQFEQTARREYDEAQKTSRKSGQRSPTSSRVVVVTKPGNEFMHSSHSAEENRVRRVDRHAYSPTGQRERVSTTIVDIDPAYRSPQPRYVEESYQVQEEYRSVKSFGGKQGGREHYASPEPTPKEYVKETIREHISISRSSSPARDPERETPRGTTPVRSVVEQFEGRIDAETRRAGVSPSPYGRTESIDEYSVVKKETKDKPKPTEVYIPRGDYIPSRPAPPPTVTPVPTPEPTPTPREVVVPPRTPEPRPPTPREVYIPRSPTPPPPPPPKEIEIPKAEPRKEDTRTTYTDRDVRVNAWEEITTTTRKLEPEPVKEEKPAEPPKKDDTKLVSSSANIKPVPGMYSSSTFETSTRTTARGDDNRTTYTAPVLPSTTSSYSTSGMTDTYTMRTSAFQSGSSRYRAPADIATGTLSGMSPFGQNAASSIRDAREREKKEMSDLNDRLASYIEKVRFLEAQNRKLANDLELLQSRWGSDSTSVRVMYETELKTAKVVIEESNRQRETLEGDIRRLSAELAEYRKKYEDALASRDTSRMEADDLLNKLAKIEAEINFIKRRITYLEEEVARIKRENQRLMNELTRTRTTIEQESLSRIDFQNQVQTLLEECQYVGRIHNNELGDLVVMAHRDTTPENREFFKNELAAAIRDIRAEYDQITHSTRTDMESWYKLRVQEIHTQSNRNVLEQNYARDEVKKLRVTITEMRSKLADLEGRNALLEKQIQELNYQLEDDQRSYEAALNERDTNIRKMRDECQALMVELQMLLDTKQTLDAEIAIYRKMLEGEENRAGLRQLVEQVVKTTSYGQQASTESVRVITSETSSRSNFQRSAKGNVSIHETSPDGRFIVIENTHRSKDEQIGEWKLKRRVDRKECVYTFPRDFVLRPMKSVKIFARGQGVHSPPDSLVFDGEENWGTGNSVQTFLYNKDGEERATLIQRQSSS